MPRHHYQLAVGGAQVMRCFSENRVREQCYYAAELPELAQNSLSDRRLLCANADTLCGCYCIYESELGRYQFLHDEFRPSSGGSPSLIALNLEQDFKATICGNPPDTNGLGYEIGSRATCLVCKPAIPLKTLAFRHSDSRKNLSPYYSSWHL